jgi:hypothetical protein
MQPIITRKQLRSAHAFAVAEKERCARIEQEKKGQFAAEMFYKEIMRVAENGAWTNASSMSMELGVAFDYLLMWTKKHFPDCEISTEIRHMSNNPTYAVHVDWSAPCEDIIIEREINTAPTAPTASTAPTAPTELPSEELQARRLEKETSW